MTEVRGDQGRRADGGQHRRGEEVLGVSKVLTGSQLQVQLALGGSTCTLMVQGARHKRKILLAAKTPLHR